MSLSQDIVSPYKSWIETKTTSGRMKQAMLGIFACTCIVLGIFLLVSTAQYLSDAETYCSQIRDSNFFVDGAFDNATALSGEQQRLLDAHPELIVWDQCPTKCTRSIRGGSKTSIRASAGYL